MNTIGAEIIVSDLWIDQTLKGDPFLTGLATGVYDRLAPPNALYPFVVWQSQTISDTRGNGSARILVDATYIVRGIAQVDSYDPLVPLAAAIDAAMNGMAAETMNGFVLGCTREETYSMVEQNDGNQIRHLGGSYRLWVQGKTG
jgi:hypothetical protein